MTMFYAGLSLTLFAALAIFFALLVLFHRNHEDPDEPVGRRQQRGGLPVVTILLMLLSAACSISAMLALATWLLNAVTTP